MKQEEIIRMVTICAKKYHDALEGRNLLFVFGGLNHIDYFEAIFRDSNFQHLTGVETVSTKRITSIQFYNRCLQRQLNPADIVFPASNVVELKLAVLPQMMDIEKTAKMIGDYSFLKSFLITEKLAGNVTACMGFIRDDKYYVPNTVLKEDIRDITKMPQQRVLAIFKKAVSEKLYHEPCYLAKDIHIETLIVPTEVACKIDKGSPLQENCHTLPPKAVIVNEPCNPTKKPSIHDRLESAKAQAAAQAAPTQPPHKSGPER